MIPPCFVHTFRERVQPTVEAVAPNRRGPLLDPRSNTASPPFYLAGFTSLALLPPPPDAPIPLLPCSSLLSALSTPLAPPPLTLLVSCSPFRRHSPPYVSRLLSSTLPPFNNLSSTITATPSLSSLPLPKATTSFHTPQQNEEATRQAKRRN